MMPNVEPRPVPSRGLAREGVSLVVCTLNEAGNVGAVLRRIPPIVTEIVVVDGRSTDDTVAEALAADPRVRVLVQDGKGKGDALRQGLHAARGAIVVQMDADGSMDPDEIPRYVEAIEEGADVVKGSRAMPGGGSSDLTRLRRFGNWFFCQTANALHGARFTDICYGFMAFRREVLKAIDIVSDGFDVEAELAIKALRAGYAVAEVPTFEKDRVFGVSHLHALRDGWRILRRIASPNHGAARVAERAAEERALVEFEAVPAVAYESVPVAAAPEDIGASTLPARAGASVRRG